MSTSPSSVILIGMPGAGKTTVGALLAHRTGRGFVDTDVLIEEAEGRALQEIVNRDGYLALRAIEERILLDLTAPHCVIATGGSAVYSRPAMEHLKSNGTAIFLDAGLSALRARVSDFSTRGLAHAPGQSLEALFAERHPLYRRAADAVVRCDDAAPDEVVNRILQCLGEEPPDKETAPPPPAPIPG